MSNEQPEAFRLLHDGIFVIFGITGDLVKRKLLPSLYQLADSNVLSDQFKIIGTTRRDTQVKDLLAELKAHLESVDKIPNQATLDKLESMISMVNMDITQPPDYVKLKTEIDRADAENGTTSNRLYYLAVPSEMFDTIVRGLGSQGMQGSPDDSYDSRLLIEKPFGSDTASAMRLIEDMEKVFDEKAIYRVDHYLAKETAQNILTFRFNNPMFKAVWDHATISHIMITASETLGIEGRANFYEKTGALRDLIQSHLMQLLALVTMEEPSDRSAEAIHVAKLKLLKSIRPIHEDQIDTYTVRGQYDSYREEAGNPKSVTETYAAIRLHIDNDRWSGVPVLLRTGKAMAEKVTEISLVFQARDPNSEDHNILTIRIQPNEGIVLSLRAKKPALTDETEMVQMEFCYDQAFAGVQPDAYERVLVDAIRGDKTLFTTDQEVLTTWAILENLLRVWEKDDKGLEVYASGTWGPERSEKLAGSVGASWMTRQLRICPVDL